MEAGANSIGKIVPALEIDSSILDKDTLQRVLSGKYKRIYFRLGSKGELSDDFVDAINNLNQKNSSWQEYIEIGFLPRSTDSEYDIESLNKLLSALGEKSVVNFTIAPKVSAKNRAETLLALQRSNRSIIIENLKNISSEEIELASRGEVIFYVGPDEYIQTLSNNPDIIRLDKQVLIWYPLPTQDAADEKVYFAMKQLGLTKYFPNTKERLKKYYQKNNPAKLKEL